MLRKIAEPSTSLLSNNYTTLPPPSPPESFQDQEQWLPPRHCHKELLELHISLCGLPFEQSMETIGAQHWCSLELVIR